MARSRKVSRKKRSAKRKTSRKVSKRCPPGCVKKPMLLTDNGKIILGSTRAAKPKRKASRKVSRKRRSVKRKVSRKKRSVKRKVSRKRRSVKRKASRKVSRKRRSVKRKASRKRKSAKRKASRKRKSAKRKSRKRKSAKRKASRKRKSAKRKASRKKTRNSPPSGVIKQQNLGVGSVMVGQDGKTMYKVVEITMRGKPVKKWAKMKFKMGQSCGKDDAACKQLTPRQQFIEHWRPKLYDLENKYQRVLFNIAMKIEKNQEELKITLAKAIIRELKNMNSEAAIANHSSWAKYVLKQYKGHRAYVRDQRIKLIKKVENKRIKLDEAWSYYLGKLMIKYPNGGHII